MLFSDETGRLQVRQIPATVWSAFRAIAAANGRAIEAEGRAAIEGWVKQNGPGALGNPATSPMRISAIVDACFRLIVDGESVLPWRRWGSAQELV